MFAALLIGRQAEILASLDHSLVGVTGTIVDETKNTLVILTPEQRQLRIPKKVVSLGISPRSRNEQKLTIKGSEIIGTPADRIKG